MQQEHMSKCLALLRAACGSSELPPDDCLEEAVKDIWQFARVIERERCAKIADSYDDYGSRARDIAAAIRKGETP